MTTARPACGLCGSLAPVAGAALLLVACPAAAQQVVLARYDPIVMLSRTEAVAVRALGDDAGELIVTEDGGGSWRAVGSLAARGVDRAGALCFGTRRGGVLVGQGGALLRTVDGGLSWRRHGSAPSGQVRGCTMFGGSRIWLLAGGALHTSWDGGRRWVTATRGTGPVRDACFTDSLRGLAVTEAGLLATASGGRTWRPVLDARGLTAVACIDRLGAWVGDEAGRVRATRDGGASWSEPVAAGLAGIDRLRFAPDGVGWATGTAEDAARSLDAGRSWRPMELPAESTAPAFLEPGLGYCGGGALHTTADRGESWATEDADYAPPPTAEALAPEPEAPDDEPDGGSTIEGELIRLGGPFVRP